MSDEPKSGRALYVILSTVRRTDDNELVVEFPDMDRTVVCDISGGVHDTREEAREKAMQWLRENYPPERGYEQHHVRAYSIPEHVLREALAALEVKESK